MTDDAELRRELREIYLGRMRKSLADGRDYLACAMLALLDGDEAEVEKWLNLAKGARKSVAYWRRYAARYLPLPGQQESPGCPTSP
jgi:hypothetical protein